ncbi:MAG: signal peptidase II [Clostridia bacterium]
MINMENNSKKLIIIEILLGIAIVAIDLITKALVDANIPLGSSIVVIEGVLNLTYVRNTGAAFSILNNQMTLFYIITPIALVALGYILVKHHKDSKLQNFALVVTIGGILGNFYDRVVYQYVRDMIEVKFIEFPVWNVADMALCVGVGMIILALVLEMIKEYKTNKENKKKQNG